MAVGIAQRVEHVLSMCKPWVQYSAPKKKMKKGKEGKNLFQVIHVINGKTV